MGESIITVSNISKKYTLISAGTKYDTLFAETVHKAKGIIKKNSRPKKNEEFWALTNISFSVNKGERIGIIGHNGAGKSTLLKIFSRITTPTEGEIMIKGKVSSLLEVGTGFHPELTGRENVYLNGAILGMSKNEIDKKFDTIVQFSEVDKFIDTPVKKYSSGMYVRLAFAVAAHLDPDILIVDEVLAVGDMKFQQKCLGKMGKVSDEGRTILYVSHNMSTVQQLCSRVIVLDKGKVIFDGDVDKGIQIYMDNVKETSTYVDFTNIKRMSHLRENRPVDMISVELIGKQTCIFSEEEIMKLSLRWKYNRKVDNLCLRIEIRYADGTSVGTSFINNIGSGLTDQIDAKEFEFDTRNLAPGSYQTLFVLYNINEFGSYDDLDAVWPAFAFRKTVNCNSIDNNWNHHGWGHVRFPDLKQI